jgi:RNA polymerase sigma-70 factor, ECF subfamily
MVARTDRRYFDRRAGHLERARRRCLGRADDDARAAFPLERAAFILHDVFNMDFEALAGVLDRNAAACRQLAARAHLHDARPRFKASAEQASKLSSAFYQAVISGDIAALGRTLAKNAVLCADGGGKRATALSPIRGRDNIIRFFEGIAHDPARPPIGRMQPILLSGLPGFVIVDGDGAVETIALEIDHDGIAAMYAVRNPEKLTHLAQSIP